MDLWSDELNGIFTNILGWGLLGVVILALGIRAWAAGRGKHLQNKIKEDL